MKLRKSRQPRRGRIEIIPMIDVMFFLLVTFMLASRSIQSLHSLPGNLPRGQAGRVGARLLARAVRNREAEVAHASGHALRQRLGAERARDLDRLDERLLGVGQRQHRLWG